MLKKIPLVFSLFALLSLPIALHAQTENHGQSGLPHMDLEMTSTELEAMLDQRGLLISMADPLQPILEMGKRNLEWITHINSKRPDGKKLQIHSPETQKGIPITAPSESNRAIISDNLTALKAELPQAMWDVIYSGAPFTDNPPIDDEAFLALARKADKVYNNASRWLLQEPYLSQYSMRQNMDIRGYYFLQREENRDQKLSSYKDLDKETQARLKPLLIGQCYNSQGPMFNTCESEFSSMVDKTGSATRYFEKYVSGARAMYNAFFDIQNSRRDVTWSPADPNLFSMPFLQPETSAIVNFLTSNIEEEWKLGDWRLKLNFKSSGSGLAHVVFVAGATPNVNGLGGNRITMDANRPLDEYTNRWTIRHEFGHVLGLPDCYIEFYDKKRGVMINYQLDIENLMCSRRGKFQQLHFDELKEHYFR